MGFTKLVAAASIASIAAASPFQQSASNASSACAQVSASVAAQSATAKPTVAAKLAYECLTSAPLNKTAALHLVDAVVPYFNWQSTTSYLKDPPAEYVAKIQQPNDVFGKLAAIKSKLHSGAYAGEFEFGFDLYTLLQSTHDGHFVYIPDSVGTVFNWARPIPLVSVSADGKALPKPYVYADVLAESLGNTTSKVSAVNKINGQDALTYLENWSQYGSLQDRDALYNNVFYELATVSLGPVGSGIGTFAGSGRGRWIYPGADTTLTFENGTTKTYQNFAYVLTSFAGITDGASLAKKYFSGPPPTPPASNATTPTPTPTATASASATPTIPAPGYPPPIFRQAQNLIGGYYLEDDYSDIAVLSVPSFVGDDSAEITFQQVGEKFLAAAKAAGKKKLIVDVSANGGGTILQGYDLYKQIFPTKIDHAAADRHRAFESTNLIGQIFSRASGTVPRQYVASPDQNETLYNLETNVVSSNFNYRTDEDVNEKPFPSWPAKFGPVPNHGDNFTNLFRWNLSDVLTPYNSGGIYIHGYGPLSNYTTQPFASEDVVVVTDGYCASTCTIFSELMRQRGGVKYISLGGRSRAGLTQAIGGVKGTNDLPWAYIQSLALGSIEELAESAAEAAALNKTELGEYYDNTAFDRLAPNTAANINFRDGIRDADLVKHGSATDQSSTPLQFVYEAADCRILYTKEMTVDVTAIWKAVADSAWGAESQSKCVAGSATTGAHGRRREIGRRQPTLQERSVSRRTKAWRATRSIADYPLDLYTDLKGVDLTRRGIMWP